jgi:hypothetical protein
VLLLPRLADVFQFSTMLLAMLAPLRKQQPPQPSLNLGYYQDRDIELAESSFLRPHEVGTGLRLQFSIVQRFWAAGCTFPVNIPH